MEWYIQYISTALVNGRAINRILFSVMILDSKNEIMNYENEIIEIKQWLGCILFSNDALDLSCIITPEQPFPFQG